MLWPWDRRKGDMGRSVPALGRTHGPPVATTLVTEILREEVFILSPRLRVPSITDGEGLATQCWGKLSKSDWSRIKSGC